MIDFLLVHLQVVMLYGINLLVCVAALVAYTALSSALHLSGLGSSMAGSAEGGATAAMLGMSSPLFLAFLPLLVSASFLSPHKSGPYSFC